MYNDNIMSNTNT